MPTVSAANLELPTSVDSITRVMEEFVRYANRDEDLPPKKALSDLITYFIGHPREDSLFCYSDAPSVLRLNRIFASNDVERRAHFIVALKEICYKYASRCTPEEFAKESCIPAITLAQFQSAVITQTPKQIVYHADIAKLLQGSSVSRRVILFCISIFNPSIEFIGDYANNPYARFMVNEILKAIPYAHPTTITFATQDHDLIGLDGRSLFLSSIIKASRLVLDGAELDRWTPDDFQHFLDIIKANPRLTELSLMNTKLDICCRDSNKFGFVLELLSLPQLTKLDLHKNNLSTLPKIQLDKLQEAIDNSPIKEIGLRHLRREHHHVGLFADHSKHHGSHIHRRVEGAPVPH